MLLLYVFEPQPEIIKKAKKLFKKIKNISFMSNEVEAINLKPDILYLGSVFQYIYNLNNFLKNIKKINPKEIIIYDLLSGSNPTFYSYQNFYGKQMLVKFYNYKYLIRKFKSIGYELIFSSNIQREILGTLQSPPMSNFKKKYRIFFPKQIQLKKKK